MASLVSPSESRYVAQFTRELLRLHWVVSACHPDLPRRDVYRKIVMAYTGGDDYEADSLLRRAEQSFATWPTARELTFADVVHYLAVSRCALSLLSKHPDPRELRRRECRPDRPALAERDSGLHGDAHLFARLQS